MGHLVRLELSIEGLLVLLANPYTTLSAQSSVKEIEHLKSFTELLVGFYGISTFVGYLTPNPFLCK